MGLEVRVANVGLTVCLAMPLFALLTATTAATADATTA